MAEELTDEEIVERYEKIAGNQYHQDFIKQQRRMMLKDTDWTQVEDIPDSIKLPYKEYRQALRDITETEEYKNDPLNIVWPQPPV